MSWLKFFLTLHLAALEILRKKQPGLCLRDTPAKSSFPPLRREQQHCRSQLKTSSSHTRQKAWGSF